MRPNAEMSSCQATFDLKAARALSDDLSSELDPHDASDPDFREATLRKIIIAAKTVPALLDEVERLQKALALKIEQHKGQAYVIGSYLGMLTDFNELNESQAKRIAELEESLQRLRAMAFSKIQRQRHAIARLSEAKRERGKALVEERARAFVESHKRTGGDWPRMIGKFSEDMACKQLRQEGKL